MTKFAEKIYVWIISKLSGMVDIDLNNGAVIMRGKHGLHVIPQKNRFMPPIQPICNEEVINHHHIWIHLCLW